MLLRMYQILPIWICHNNQINTFHTSHAELRHLGDLNLAHNNLVQVPQFEGYYSTPLNLNIGNNNIRTTSILEFKTHFNISDSALRSLSLARNLDFTNNVTEIIDYIIKNFPNIGHIDLSYLNIKELPDLKSYNLSSISLSLDRNQIIKHQL